MKLFSSKGSNVVTNRASRTFHLALLFLLLLGSVPAAFASFVYETDTEFISSGDFNGDGLPDVLVLDKATGNVRVGYQDNLGALNWSAALVTGVARVTGCTVGHFLDGTREALAVTASELNRVYLFDLSNSNSAAPPVVVTPAGLGPHALTGLAAPFSGVPLPFASLVVASSLNDAPAERLELLMLNAGGVTTSLQQTSVSESGVFERLNELQLGAGTPSVAVGLVRGSNDTLCAWQYTNYVASVAFSRSNLPPGGDYVFGAFNNEALPRFVFYVPGQSNLMIQPLEQTTSGLDFAAGFQVSFTQAVQRIFYTQLGGDGTLLIQFGDGMVGARPSSGGNTLSNIYRFGPDTTGNVLTAAVPLGDGRFALLSAPAGGGASAHAQVFQFNAGTYVATNSSDLPARATLSSRANVWLFDAEPFVNDQPGFIASLNAGDWVTGLSGLPGALLAQTESDRSLSSGLGNDATNNLGAVPAGSAYGLANQYRAAISLFSYSSPRRVEPVHVTISPPPGSYPRPVSVSFTTLNPTDATFYLAGASNAWRRFTAPFVLSNDTQVAYYGQTGSGSARSSLQFAGYSFGSLPLAPVINVNTNDNGGTNTPPITNTNTTGFQLSLNGTVFYGRSNATNGTIWAINLDGSGDQFITTGARPRVSHDGRYLAFLRDGSPLVTQGNAWVRDLLTGQETMLFTNQNYVIGFDWDLTGTNLVFDFSCWLFRIGLSGPGSVLPLITDCYDDAPVINPIDGRLAFHNLNPSAPNGAGLYLTTPQATAKQRVNLNVAGASWPAWSPDGQWLAFADGNNAATAFTADGGTNLYVVRPDGTDLNPITGFSDGTNRFPHGALWSPAGDALVGAGTIFGTNGVWIIPLTLDLTECDGMPWRLPTTPGDPIDFAGSVVVAPEPPQTVFGPGLFIRLDPDAVVVYWGAIYADFTLEAATDLPPSSTWTSINGPYDFDGYFYQYREPLTALQQKRFFRLSNAPTVALNSKGTVVAWGWNGDGQTDVPAGLSGVTAIAGGYTHTVALKSDGMVVAWGDNSYGKTNVPAGLSNVTAIAAGSHTLALKSDGTVVAWGDHGWGQTTVPAGLSNVTAIAAGLTHSVALKSDGTVVAWGDNSYGQRTVPAGLSGVTAIAGGGAHTVALKSDGTVVAWGYDGWGQTTVPAGLGGVAAIAAGGNHTVALRIDGTVVAWGNNGYGQTTVPAGLSGVTAIAAGYYYTVALKSDGTVVAWGDNSHGQTNVPAGLSGVTAIAAGGYHAVALVGRAPPH
jgi:Tol biopolymer transport system component